MTGTIIGIIGTIVGIIGYIIKITMDYSRQKTQLNDFKESYKEDKKIYHQDMDDVDKKFSVLYDSRYETGKILKELTTTLRLSMDNFSCRMESLEKKIDKIYDKDMKK